ncbi:hypothetical protein MNBD_GAMMA22-1946 [hydrothermal vent metagenome]|uniref:Uncharacterized protein n=1 Tax=hydrothermal vent metagenome TaxID=652676 RepID=A0A3B1B8P5_9ZZZZ
MFGSNIYVVVLIFIFSFYSQASVLAKISEDPRGAFISKLINESSGSKQVKKSNNPDVKKIYQQAKDLLDDASEQFTLGNIKQGSLLLDKSAKKMFSAIRLARPQKLGTVKKKHDYDNRKKTVYALRKALNRINTGKNTDEQKKINAQLDKILAMSASLEQLGKYSSAKIELDKAYALLQSSIELVRGGQTLVRSLNFATPEDEYKYELDRYNTHKMLIKLLLGEKNNSDYVQKAVLKFTTQATLLKKQAETAAIDKQFKEAISLLEKSTKQLVRAIRSAGVYIPG